MKFLLWGCLGRSGSTKQGIAPDGAHGREWRREAQRFVDRTLSASAAALREWDERAREAHTHDARVTLVSGCAEWREGARQALADCRKILDDLYTFGRHLDRRPGAADEMNRLSSRIESDLEAEDAEIRRRRQQERQKEEQEKQERRKGMTRGRGGGISM